MKKYIKLIIRTVNEIHVDGIAVYDPVSSGSNYDAVAIRPVVALSDNVKIDSYASSTVAISLND